MAFETETLLNLGPPEHHTRSLPESKEALLNSRSSDDVAIESCFLIGLNIFYSGGKYTEKDWARLICVCISLLWCIAETVYSCTRAF